MRDARWIDLGTLDPLDLHATYTGVAQAQDHDAPPVVLWGEVDRPHLSIGASQCAAAELDLERCRERGVPVIRRPLGGGNVWIDQHQPCLFIIFPRGSAPRRHPELFSLCLPPLVEVFGQYGLRARPVGIQDLWVGERKILGSGAATVGSAMVFGTSFLLRFDADAFASVIRCDSDTSRGWLSELLRHGMTDWRREGVEPSPRMLAGQVRTALESAFGWALPDAIPNPCEREAIDEARDELSEPPEAAGKRYVPYGIKVNASTFLVEGRGETGRMRLVLRGGHISRLWHGDPDLCNRLQALCGVATDDGALSAALQSADIDADVRSCIMRDIEMLKTNTGM